MQDIRELFVPSIRETIQLAVHNHNYKNGAFKNVIRENTSAFEALEIFLASSLLSESEKAETNLVRETIIDYEKTKWVNASSFDLLMKGARISGFSKMFDEDSRKRGQYVPPMLMQSLDDDGNVSSTHTVDDDSNGQSMPGGKLGVVPGAPEWFNHANAKHMADMGFGHRGAKNGQRASSGQAERKKKDKPKEANNTKFGSAFEKNLRNAFR